MALDIDDTCVPAHSFKVDALRLMCAGKATAKGLAKARKACAKGLAACDRVVACEGLSVFRERFRAAATQLDAVVAPPAPAPKKKKPQQPEPPRKIDAAPSAPAPPPRPASVITTADVRAAGGVAPKKSDWNSKDTWEERDVSSWAVERFAELLCEPTNVVSDDLNLKFFDVRRVTGDAQVVAPR